MHTHTYTHIHTRIQHIHMHTRKHAWNDSGAATARGVDADAGSFAHLLCSTQSATFSTPMLGLHWTHFLRHQYPSTPHPLFLTYPRTVYRQRQTRVYCSTLINTTEYTTLKEGPCSFTMAPCVVVERLEGKHGCSRAPLDKRAGCRARECTMWLFTRNERSTKNNQTPQKPVTPSRQRASQTTPADLHWCGADSPSPWPAQAAGHGGDTLKQGYISAIFAGPTLCQYTHGFVFFCQH